ncbi:MAG: phosphoribosylanthranilate isomerase [Paracoccaceae bacterium]|nr:phosphoribosylanthranilate isomerase [Paracoccaceae bacterium]
MKVKICGLTTAEAVAHAAREGADYLGFVFYPRSPRSLELETAARLAGAAPVGPIKVALIVDADDAFLDRLTAEVPVDMLQLHGHEAPERVAEIRNRFGLPVMKAIGVAKPSDVDRIAAYEAVADQLLIDAKPPDDPSYLPGGNALSFDWRLIAGRTWARPWMLAGGLRPETVAEAARLTGATQFDVSSGVESAPGVKDLGLITQFIRAVREAEPVA